MEDLIVKLAPELTGLPIGTPSIIEDGMIWLEPIENILTKSSCDGASPSIAEEEDDEENYWEMPWKRLLSNKRRDYCYDSVLTSLSEYGFVRPVTVSIDAWDNTDYEYGDGHHRLAAAIDLGFTHVPVEAYSGYNISDDSGVWDGTVHGARISNPEH